MRVPLSMKNNVRKYGDGMFVAKLNVERLDFGLEGTHPSVVS